MIPTSTISDALDLVGLAGQVPRLIPLVPGTRCAGAAFTVRFDPVDDPADAPAANYLERVPPGAVIVLDNAGRQDCTVWGGLLATDAHRREIAGTVVWGACRDIAENRALGYPLFACGAYMRTGKGRVKCAAVGETVNLGGVEVVPGDWVVADDDGVVCVPAALWPEVSACAGKIQEIEDRILTAVSAGMDLAEARWRFGYDQVRLRGTRHA